MSYLNNCSEQMVFIGGNATTILRHQAAYAE